MKRILIRGSGSIAAKYIQTLSKHYSIDLLTDKKHIGNLPKFNLHFELNKPPQSKYDLIIIASRTQEHVTDYINYRNLAEYCLIEKPVVSSAQQMNPYLLKDSKCWMSAPLRYDNNFKYLTSLLSELKSPFKINAVTKSWFPDWRKNRNSDQGYWMSKTDGGMVREQSHELDYLYFFFGNPSKIDAIGLKTQNFFKSEIADKISIGYIYEDRGEAKIDIDVSSRNPERYLYIKNKIKTIIWDILSGKLTILDNQSLNYEIKFNGQIFNLNDALSRQVSDIFENIDNIRLPNMSEAFDVTKIIDKVEHLIYQNWKRIN
jgi:predicted dehydrogenase